MRPFIPFAWLSAAALLITSSTAFPQASEPRCRGKLIDIGGYRIHALTSGRRGPNVILLSGMGDFSVVWGLVQPRVAEFARVTSYDRAGEAWSDPGPVPRTLRQESHELHLLLQRARLEPPYVLVGASYGGLIARRYAADHPAQVGGIVFVDATHENTILSLGSMVNGKFEERLVRIRQSASGRPVPPAQTMGTSPPKPASAENRKNWEAFMKQMGPPTIQPPFDRLPAALQQAHLWFKAHPKLTAPSEDYMAEEFQELYQARSAARYPLAGIPVISLRAGKNAESAPAAALLATLSLTAEDWRREAEAKAADLASLSSDSIWYVARGSGHHIHLEDPELVTFAVRRVVEAVRKRTSLASLPPHRGTTEDNDY